MKSCGCGGALPCGCCAGTEPITPETEFNRPGLSALRYRAGTHSTFFETMVADLSKDRRLDGLSTRELSDASIALLDAWATVGDVLTFYQERIANEGYLGTATERRSALELANLVGYRPRPGVSASVFLAYTIDDGAEAVIPVGSLARSVPADGEAQQAFETSEPLEARATWNNLQVRLTRPHTKNSILTERAVYLKGIVTSVHEGDPLFVQFAAGDVVLCRVLDVVQNAAAGRTRVSLEEWTDAGKFRVSSALALVNQLRPLIRVEDFGLTLANSTVKGVLPILQGLVNELDLDVKENFSPDIEKIKAFRAANPPRSQKAIQWLKAILAVEDDSAPPPPEELLASVDDIAANAGLLGAPSLSPKSQYHRTDDIRTAFDARAGKGEPDVFTHVAGSTLETLGAFRSTFRKTLARALANAKVTADPAIRVYVVTRTAPFGYNAAPRATTVKPAGHAVHTVGTPMFTTEWDEWPLEESPDLKNPNVIDLEKEFEKIAVTTLVAVQPASGTYTTPRLRKVSTESRAAYGLAGKTTRLEFADKVRPTGKDLGSLRSINVFLASDELPLAEQPILDPVCGSDPAVELDGLYEGLAPGKWIILTGERQDTVGTSGVEATELLLIGDVQHRTALNLAGDRVHSFLQVVVPSAYCYKRDAVKIYGNVVKATNGETRKEVIGSGDASILFQKFPLKQPPLTYVTAPSASGSASTLHIYVNDLEWHGVDTLVGLAPSDRTFFTKTADAGTTTVIFGNGVSGTRLPTGSANVRATYRNGIGQGGNVQPGQLTILGSKPLGVKEVINPLRASGGADKDSRDQIRTNAPLSVTALDRLVSVDDYAHFARTFAGIGKAKSTALTDGHRQLVHITVAGIDDIPIDPTSDLYLNLRHALHLYGDRNQPLQLDVRAAKFLVLQAGAKVDPDYPWEVIAPAMRAALLSAFRFDCRELGQAAFLSEALDVLQRVPGVEFVDVNLFGSIPDEALTPSAISSAIAALTRQDMVSARLAEAESAGITPAEIVYFTPEVPATIALNQL